MNSIEKYYIYKIVSPNNKIYIGQTKNIYKRFNAYKNLNCKSQVKLYNAIKKYRWENFKTSILLIADKNNVDLYEKNIILLYDSVNLGLNCESGGNKNKILSEETKNKISKSRIGKYGGINHPLFGINRYDLSIKFKGSGNPMFGKKQSNEFKKMMSDRMSGENHPFYGKKRIDVSINNKKKNKQIYAYDINDNFIQKFNSVKEAQEKLNIFNISKVLKGKFKQTKGYKFKYAGETE